MLIDFCYTPGEKGENQKEHTASVWVTLYSSYFESRGEDPGRTRFQIDCLHAPTLAPGSLILLPIGWWSESLLPQKMRGHIDLSIPIRRIKSTDRSHIKHQTLHHHHCLLHACRGLFPVGCLFLCLNGREHDPIMPCIILRTGTTGACKKCPSY